MWLEMFTSKNDFFLKKDSGFMNRASYGLFKKTGLKGGSGRPKSVNG